MNLKYQKTYNNLAKSNKLDSDYLDLLSNDKSIVSKAHKKHNIDPQNFISWHWQINHQIRTFTQAIKYINIDSSYENAFLKNDDLFEVGITPYYLSLAGSRENKHKTNQILWQALPSIKEVASADQVHLIDDPLKEKDQSPVDEVIHIYPDRVAFCVARLCPVYCRYCFRKRRDEHKALHFNEKIIKKGIDYIKSQPAIKDVLITGGDPFIASDQAIEDLLSQLSKIKHIKIIRFGTRTCVTLPYRITDNLCKILKKYHPIWLNTHFNCTAEISEDAKLALSKLADHGICVGNQSVLLKNINDNYNDLKDLCLTLVQNRVRPYYLFHPHNVTGTDHFKVPITKGLDLVSKLRGKLSGYAIPLYMLDTPSGKIHLTESTILAKDNKDILIKDLNGQIWREKNSL